MDETDMEEEVESLSAIFCGGEEDTTIITDEESKRTFKIRFSMNKSDDITLTVALNPGYPSVPPTTVVAAPTLTRAKQELLGKQIREFAEEKSTLGADSPYLLELTWFARQACLDIIKDSKQDHPELEVADGKNDQFVSVFKLDHMRDFRGYSRLLRQWSCQLGLSWGGVLAPPSHRGVIVVAAAVAAAAVDAFEKRLRTVMVDVDSKGRPCKERQMRVLIQRRKIDLSNNVEKEEFKVLDNCDNIKEAFLAFPGTTEEMWEEVSEGRTT